METIAGMSSETLKIKKRDREANWAKEEELLLLEEVEKRSKVLFGSFSGPSGSVMSKQSKQAAWDEITTIFNSRSASSRRTTEQLKKKRANLKQKAKAKVSELKYPKTGGGLIAMPSPAVQVMIDQLEGTPGLGGIVGGIDTSDVIPMDTSYTEDTTLSNTVDMEVTLSYTVDMEVTDLPVIIHPSTSKKRKTELTEEILNLEKTKIEEEIKLIKERQTLAKLQTELSKLKISKINPAQTFDL